MKEVLKRSLFAFLFIGLIALLLYFYEYKIILTLVLSLFLIALVLEYVKLVEKKNIFLSKTSLIIASLGEIFSVYLATEYASLKLLPLLFPFLFFVFLFVNYFRNVKDSLFKIALSSFGFIYIVVPVSFFLAILYFPQNGRLWFIYLLLVTKASDIGAYFGGKLFGKHLLAPIISPKKTREGALFGFCASMLASLSFSPFFGLANVLILGVILSIFAQVGDLAESLLKRDAEIKDSGIVPGLGGLLDIVDSLLFNALIVYLFLIWQ